MTGGGDWKIGENDSKKRLPKKTVFHVDREIHRVGLKMKLLETNLGTKTAGGESECAGRKCWGHLGPGEVGKLKASEEHQKT